jgi:hypothetical protein
VPGDPVSQAQQMWKTTNYQFLNCSKKGGRTTRRTAFYSPGKTNR